MTRPAIIGIAAAIMCVTALANIVVGAKSITIAEVIRALVAFDETTYDHFIVLYQRLPRALIAVFIGAMMAVCGAVLQGLSRNPLASPSLLGVTSGATLFVVMFGFYFHVPAIWHGLIAFAGGWCGFLTCIALARIAGVSHDPRNIGLILAGAITSLLYAAIANALLLSDPGLRADLLGWVSGNINHVYIQRLWVIWPVGLITFTVLMVLAKPLTLITLGHDKAQSAGVAVKPVTGIAVFAAVSGAAASVSICGPIGFIGLGVPHIVRPFAGAHFATVLPVNAFIGGTVALIADVVARVIFAPFVLNTSVVLDLLGGLIFIVIVKRYYLTNLVRAAA